MTCNSAIEEAQHDKRYSCLKMVVVKVLAVWAAPSVAAAAAASLFSLSQKREKKERERALLQERQMGCSADGCDRLAVQQSGGWCIMDGQGRPRMPVRDLWTGTVVSAEVKERTGTRQ